jgi:hypothetical protein
METQLLLEQQTFALRQFIADEVAFRGNLDIEFIRNDLAYGFVMQLRAQLYTHKLPAETRTETSTLVLPTWNSAWQLWKANHANSKLFGWIARRWPAKKRGSETHMATVTFDLDRRVLFPECNYPERLGTPYMRVDTTTPKWYCFD